MPIKYSLRVFLAGFASTLIMTLVTLPMWQLNGMQNMDFISVIGAELLKGPVEVGSSSWWFAAAEHFFNGAILFPAIYAFALYKIIPGHSALKGLIWGLVLWVGWQAIVMPAVGLGFFSLKTAAPAYALFITLNGHMIYGILLGLFIGHPKEVGEQTEFTIQQPEQAA